jgi:ABC-2 family transporter protein
MSRAIIAEGPIFVLSASYAVMCALLLHNMTADRLSALKTVQLVQGLKLSSYWIGNYLFDVLYLHILTGTTQTILTIFDPIWRVSLFVYALWPFMVVPVLYGISFFCKKLDGTQSILIPALLLSLLCFSQLMFLMRIISALEFVGDIAMWILSLIPCFPLV